MAAGQAEHIVQVDAAGADGAEVRHRLDRLLHAAQEEGLALFVSSSGFQLRQRFFSHVARKGFRFGKGVPLSLFGFAS